MSEAQESLNAVFRRFLQAISEVDYPTLKKLATESVTIDIPGARFVDITKNGEGIDALCEWAATVQRECGNTTFNIHRYFENGCELMANATIRIERLPRLFESPCSLHVRFEAGRIAAFQLLLDTYALQKFRGEMD